MDRSSTFRLFFRIIAQKYILFQAIGTVQDDYMKTSHETGAFDILRYILQGGCPSPFDRIQGTRQATFAVDWLVEKIEENKVAGNYYKEVFQET